MTMPSSLISYEHQHLPLALSSCTHAVQNRHTFIGWGCFRFFSIHIDRKGISE
jgi:hypothetical protein